MSRYACQCQDCRNWYLSDDRLSLRCDYCAEVHRTEMRRMSITRKAERAATEFARRSWAQRHRRTRERQNARRRERYQQQKQQRAIEIVQQRLAEIAPGRRSNLAGSAAELPSFGPKQPNGCVATAKCATGIYGGH